MSAVENVETWTDAQLRFIQWLALPKAERKPKTQRLFATEVNVTETTLGRWKQLPGFRDTVARTAKEFMKDDTSDVLGAIRKFAKQGSIPHINMFLSMTGLASDVEAAGKGPVGDSDGARNRLLEKLNRHLEESQRRPTADGDRGAES